MQIVVLEEIPQDPELRQAWNGLALQMERPEVFYTYEWALAAHRAFKPSCETLLYLGYKGESLGGVVALARPRNGNRSVGFLAANTADYCDFISSPDNRAAFVSAVLRELQSRKRDRIVLTNLPTDSCSVAAISAAAVQNRYHLHSRSAYSCARIVLGAGEQRAGLKQLTESKKRLRRNLRELGKRGTLSVYHDTDWAKIEPALEPFHRAHVARFLSTGRISTLVSEERRNFLYELARELSRSGWLALSRLMVGEAPVAWHYGFQFAGSWFWYQPTVESGREYADFSAGYCLLAKIVEQACDHPEIDLVDLGLGAEEYKERFATTYRETMYFEMNRSVLDHVQTVSRSRAAIAVKARPSVERGLRAMIAWSSNVRGRRSRDLVTPLIRRLRNFVFSSDRILFFEGTVANQQVAGVHKLVALNSDILGAAAIRYADDSETVDFLMRSAQRFRCETDRGFALVDPDGNPVAFCWTKDFEGFEMPELRRKLDAPTDDAVMIFDCFCPRAFRENEFFTKAIAVLAAQLRAQGKTPWIFAGATDQRLQCAIQEAGFDYSFSLARKTILFFTSTTSSIPSPPATSLARSAA